MSRGMALSSTGTRCRLPIRSVISDGRMAASRSLPTRLTTRSTRTRSVSTWRAAMTEIERRGAGLVMFATRAPGQVAAQPDPSGAVVNRGARSGNAKFDPVTGRFAGGKSKDLKDGNGNDKEPARNPGAGNIDPTAAQRRRDLTRRAASLMGEMNMTEASKWLESLGVDTSIARVDTFLADVREQRIDYLVDTMVPVLESTVAAQHEGQVVTLKSPKSWNSAVMNSLTDAEMVQLHQRLVGQGFDSEDVSKNLIDGMRNKKRKTQLQQVFGEPTEEPPTKGE